jgi:hypothetical protein
MYICIPLLNERLFEGSVITSHESDILDVIECSLGTGSSAHGSVVNSCKDNRTCWNLEAVTHITAGYADAELSSDLISAPCGLKLAALSRSRRKVETNV